MRRTDHRAAHPRSAAHAHDTALFVALELSRSTWLMGSSIPGSDRTAGTKYVQLIRLLFLPC